MRINTAWGTGVIAPFPATAISIVMQSAARNCSGTARNAPFQRDNVVSKGERNASETRRLLPVLSHWEFAKLFSLFIRSFVRLVDRSIDECSIDRERDRDTLFARSWRNVKTLTTIYDTGFWLLPLFYGIRASFLRWDNRRMNGKWVKSVSEKIKSSEKLLTIARHKRQ